MPKLRWVVYHPPIRQGPQRVLVPAAVRLRSNRRPTNVPLLAYGRFRHGTDEKGKPTANWRATGEQNTTEKAQVTSI